MSSTVPSPIRSRSSVSGKDELIGSDNYLNWIRNMRATLRHKNLEYVLDDPIPKETTARYTQRINDIKRASCIMISAMSPKLKRHFKNTWAFEINVMLATMFEQKSRQARLDIIKSLTTCKLKEGVSVYAHVSLLKSYTDKLENLDARFDKDLVIDLVLGSLPSSYDEFAMSYRMKKEKTLLDLYVLLLSGKARKKKDTTSHVHTGKGKEILNPVPIRSDAKEAICPCCKEIGHWIRYCPQYQKDLKVLLQGLKEGRKLKHKELDIIKNINKRRPL